MTRQPVTSSRVKSIGWEKGTMEVEFNDGSVYQYTPIEWQRCLQLMRSPTLGRDIQEIIKDKTIKCTKQ